MEFMILCGIALVLVVVLVFIGAIREGRRNAKRP